MKLEYDKEADAAYIRLRKGKVRESVELGRDVIVDVGKDGEVIGVEILHFSENKDRVKEILEAVARRARGF